MHPAEAKARELDNPEHSKKESEMVWQVWSDGEITLQKCGDLLWQRSLHSVVPAIPGADPKWLKFPHPYRGGNSLAWVASEEEARTVRDLIKANQN